MIRHGHPRACHAFYTEAQLRRRPIAGGRPTNLASIEGPAADIALPYSSCLRDLVSDGLEHLLAVARERPRPAPTEMRVEDTPGAASVVWSGPLLDPSGYGDENRHMVLAAEEAGVPVAAPVTPWSRDEIPLSPLEQKRLGDLALCPAAPGFVQILHNFPRNFTRHPQAGVAIGMRMFEPGLIVLKDGTLLCLHGSYGAGGQRARVSEVCGLCWGDVQERGEGKVLVAFRGKGRQRAVLLPAALSADLLALREGAGADTPVFQSRRGGPLTPMHVVRIVRHAAERAGIEGRVSPHWLRHAYAIHALERGVPIHLVQATLGHASVSTTGQYLHARPHESSSLYLPHRGRVPDRRLAVACQADRPGEHTGSPLHAGANR